MNPVANGMFMLAGLAGALALWPNGKDDAKSDTLPHETLIRRCVLCLMVVIILFGIYATKTRSVWVAALMVTTPFVWRLLTLRGRGGLLIGGLVSGVLVIGLFGNSLNSFKRDKYLSAAETAESITLRPMLATVALDMFQDRPMTGFGFGQYTRAKRPYHLKTVNGASLQKVIPFMQHNIVLSYLTELGLLGVFLLLGIISGVTHAAIVVFRRTRCHMSRQTMLVALVLLAAWLFNGMFHDVSIIPMIGSLIYFWFGVVNEQYSRQLAYEPATEPVPDAPATGYAT